MVVFARSDGLPAGPHEQVVFCRDEASGLRAIIAIYSTALGPGLGGTRMYPYATEDDALDDVLNLSRAMAYKSACANLEFGGGKAVILADPATDKSPELLHAYGRYLSSLGGRYYTACDVGTFVEDMDVIAQVCPYVTGRSVEHGGAGDSSILTAFGVFQGMRAAALTRWGAPTVQGRRVGVTGVGKVGHRLVDLLIEDGARVVVADVDRQAVARVCSAHPSVEVLDVDGLPAADLDVFAPCALGGALDAATVGALQAEVVCGAANNQLADPGVEQRLTELGVLYAPDYVVNAGGLIAVADEVNGYSEDRARARTAEIFDTALAVFTLAAEEGLPPGMAADRLAERRMAQRKPAPAGPPDAG